MDPYLSIVQIKGPTPPGPNLEVCVMSLVNLDRAAPVFLLFLGLVAAVGVAGLGI